MTDSTFLSFLAGWDFEAAVSGRTSLMNYYIMATLHERYFKAGSVCGKEGCYSCIFKNQIIVIWRLEQLLAEPDNLSSILGLPMCFFTLQV